MTFSLKFGLAGCGFQLDTDSRRIYDFWAAYAGAFDAAGAADFTYLARTKGGFFFARKGEPPMETDNEGRLIEWVEKTFLFDLAETLTGQGWRMLHAAGLADGDAADVYLGQSGVGKSTWCVRQIQAGRTYLSDELVAVKEGRVMALPRPVCFVNRETRALSYPLPEDGFTRISYHFGADYEYEGFCPPPERTARAGQIFTWRTTSLLERDPGRDTTARLLEGAELRARLALSTFREYR